MTLGTHNLGSNAFSQVTLAKVSPGGLTLIQVFGANRAELRLSAEQAGMLRDLLA